MIRWASAADVDSIASVQVASWAAGHRDLLPGRVIDGVTVADRAAQWGRFFAEPPARSGMFIAEHDGEIVGIAQVGPTRDEDLDPVNTAEIVAVYVLPDHWRHGHGRALMAWALEWLAEAGFIVATLWVLAGNDRGRRFFEVSRCELDDAERTEFHAGAEIRELRYWIEL